MCFVYPEKVFYKVPRNVLEWAMMKKVKPTVLVRLVMSLYEGQRTNVRVVCEFSD